jgi:hypothetical protein
LLSCTPIEPGILDVLDEYPENDVFIIPARLNDCLVEDIRLKKIQYADLFRDWEAGIDKVCKTIDTYA